MVSFTAPDTGFPTRMLNQQHCATSLLQTSSSVLVRHRAGHDGATAALAARAAGAPWTPLLHGLRSTTHPENRGDGWIPDGGVTPGGFGVLVGETLALAYRQRFKTPNTPLGAGRNVVLEIGKFRFCSLLLVSTVDTSSFR